jgi:hypothetical protein
VIGALILAYTALATGEELTYLPSEAGTPKIAAVDEVGVKGDKTNVAAGDVGTADLNTAGVGKEVSTPEQKESKVNGVEGRVDGKEGGKKVGEAVKVDGSTVTATAPATNATATAPTNTVTATTTALVGSTAATAITETGKADAGVTWEATQEGKTGKAGEKEEGDKTTEDEKGKEKVGEGVRAKLGVANATMLLSELREHTEIRYYIL